MSDLVLNQCLHGYRDGHQLLASSKNLSQISQQELLFQTDLSGSKVDDGFDSYITCYPLNADNLYAISRTWYASEMPRPGCVWTQTLLVDFADVGKINDLAILLTNFKRPTVNEYESYQSQLVINSETSNINLINDIYSQIANQLYTNASKTIIIPSRKATQYEETLINIWNDQWPRLRRNFTFCTGALSLKTLNGKEFDLQIVPETNLYLVERQSENLIVVDFSNHLDSDWMQEIKNVSKEQLKAFLWTYGSDISGERKNYKALVEIFMNIYRKDSFSIRKVAETIANYFPLKEDAKFLKSSFFGDNSALSSNVSEKELVIFLIKHNVELKFIEDEDVKIRTTELLKQRKLNFGDLISASSKDYNDLTLEGLWEFVDGNNIAEFFDQYPELIDDLAEKRPDMFFDYHFWKLPISIQKKILGAIYNAPTALNISKIVEAVLTTKSEIIFDFGKLYPTATIHSSLDWLNAEADRQFTSNWTKTLFNNHDVNTFKWYNVNIKDLSDNALTLLMENIAVTDMHRINFSHKTWVNIYHRNSDPSPFGFKLAAFGFRDKISGSEWLVAETLSNIFHSLKSTNKQLSEFSLPTESNLEDEIYTPYQYISQIIWGNPKSQKRSKNAIDQTFLQVVLSHFIKNRWSTQAFLDGLKDDHLFAMMLHIAFQSNKGTYFISDVIDDIKRKKIQAYGNQISILMEIANRY